MDRMTDAEINRRLAEKLGWPFISWERFSPATDSNHLREYVLPEVERRGLERQFERAVFDAFRMTKRHMRAWKFFRFTAPPRVLALAALKVMEESK